MEVAVRMRRRSVSGHESAGYRLRESARDRARDEMAVVHATCVVEKGEWF